MNITKEQAKMALSVLTAYVEGNSSADLDVTAKCLLTLQNKDDYLDLFVDMTCDTEYDLAFRRMEDFDDIFRDIPPFEVAIGIASGKFDPYDGYFYLTDNNEIISVSSKALLPVAYKHFNEVLEYVIDTNRINWLIKNLEKRDKKE